MHAKTGASWQAGCCPASPVGTAQQALLRARAASCTASHRQPWPVACTALQPRQPAPLPPRHTNATPHLSRSRARRRSSARRSGGGGRCTAKPRLLSPGCRRSTSPRASMYSLGAGGGGGRGVLAWDMGAGKGGSGPELLRAQPTLSVYAPAQRVGRGAGCSCGGGIRGATCQLPGPCMQALGLVAATPRWALAQQRWARVPPEGVRRAVPLQRQRQALVEAPRPKLRLQAVELVAARAGAPPCGAGSAAVAGARARATLRLPCLLGLPPALPPGLLLGCQVQRQQQRGLLGIVVTNKVLQGDAWSGAVL